MRLWHLHKAHMTKITVHMIGQGHLDPVWLWRWTEGRAEALATSQSAVDRLREYADFQFTRGESQVYEWTLREDPELFAQIRALIAQGRWHVVNGMVIQPDMNLPTGEALVRQVLIGKAFMREWLHAEPRVAYCVDSFGHAGTLPQILAKCGFESYIFSRPKPHEKQLPANVFWWQAPDGSRVLAFRIVTDYHSKAEDHTERIAQVLETTPKELQHAMGFFGVGDHGGGPTKQQIEHIQALAAERSDIDIRFSSPQAYFDAIRADAQHLPTVAEELQYHAVGCYSVVSAIKRGNRQAEQALLLAERMAALAYHLVGFAVPLNQLRTLWQDLCFNQFHDTLGGTSVKTACDDAVLSFGRVTLSANEICNDAGRAIAAQVNTRGGNGALLVFNPFPEPHTPYVEYEPWTDWQHWEHGNWSLFDDQGRAIACQRLDPNEALTGTNGGIVRLLFRTELPPMGYRAYRFAPNMPAVSAEGSAHATSNSLENQRWRFQFDPQSGIINSCTDKRTGIEFAGAGGWNVAQVLDDLSDTWSHGVRGYDRIVGVFGEAEISVASNGPLEASLLIERRYGASVWQQQFILRHGEDGLLIRNWLHWHGRWQLVKLAFDVATESPTACHDIPFGWCTRPCDGAEVPTHLWMDVSGTPQCHTKDTIGAALLNDGKYSCDVAGSTMRLTVLRCPPYAYHEPHPVGMRARYDWIDQGPQEFNLVLVPHVGDWRDAGIVAQARTLNMPPPVVTTHHHNGRLPGSTTALELTTNEAELTAFKVAEDGGGFVVRIADRHGHGGSGDLVWQGVRFSITLTPFEVCTFRLVERDGTWCLHPCSMSED